MKKINKKLQIYSILMITLIIFTIQLPVVFSEEEFDSEKVLMFLEDVANIDLEDYTVKLLGTISSNIPELGDILQVTGKYELRSSEELVNVLFKFRNNTLSYCLLDVLKSKDNQRKISPKEFLCNYQTFSDDSTIEIMKNVLNTIDVTQNETKQVGEMKLEVSNTIQTSSFEWKHTINGAEYTGLSVSFKNGSFHAFRDDRSYYTIGNVDVNLSEEDAVNLALLQAEDLSWSVPDGTQVSDFNIVEDKIGIQLLSRSKEPLTLHPYWLVILPLDRIYPGMVSSIMVMVWADTSEVISCNLLGQGGEVTGEISSLTEQNVDSAELFSPFTLMFVSIIVLMVGALLLFKTKKNDHAPYSVLQQIFK